MKTTVINRKKWQTKQPSANNQAQIGTVLQAYKKSANQTTTPTIQCVWSPFKNITDAFKALYPLGLSQGPLDSDRSQLEDVSSRSSSFFGKSVDMVNRNLGTRTDAVLPPKKKKEYMKNIPLVDSGEMSNSSAFASSAYNWAKEGNLPAMGLNLLGFLASGSIDSMNYKKGKLK